MEKSLSTSASSPLSDVTCPLCNNVFYEPVTLTCGNSYCKRCILTHLACSQQCPITGAPLDRDTVLRAPINEELTNKVNVIFPMYKVLRQRLQGASEKRWWFDLHEKRTGLCTLREKLIEVRKDKMSALNTLRESFCNFIKTCKKENLYKKEFEKEHMMLAKRQECAKTSVPLTKERCEAFATLPGHCCCLRSLLLVLEDSLLKGPDQLAASYDKLKAAFNGEGTLPPCGECGNANILSHEGKVPGCETSVRDEIAKLTERFEDLFKASSSSAAATDTTMEDSSAQSSCVVPSSRSPSCAAAPSNIVEDKFGLSSETILVTCAKLFGQNGEAETKKTLAELASTNECGGEADSDDDFLECCQDDAA